MNRNNSAQLRIPEGFRPVSAETADLVERQSRGQLYWIDPEPLPPWFFGDGHYRIARLSKFRHDFTLSTLQKWASLGQLLEKID